MVSILQALKYTLFYFIPLTASMGAMFLAFFLADIHQVTGGIAYSDSPIPIWGSFLIFIGAAIIFIFFMLKAIGDITEAALIE